MNGYGKSNEAISCYEKALAIKPDYAEAYSQLFHQLQRICDWQKLKGMEGKLDDFTKEALDKARKTAETPFINITRYTDLSRNFAVAGSWSCNISKAMSKLNIHFSFDMRRYTDSNRLEICALRPAPVQVRYLGLAGTTGADFFDYLITDRVVTPEEHAHCYSENFAYMPHSYQVNNTSQTISKQDWRKVDVGLPERGFVFCSFNEGYKIEPVMFNSWMNILREVPDGILWLLRVNETAAKNLRQEAEARGVRPERLVFAGKLLKGEHLARLRLADLALDTRIVNGAATTSDALWAGVPVITLKGDNFASRMSSSILTGIGLSELIVHSIEEY